MTELEAEQAAKTAQARWTEVDQYFTHLLGATDPVLEAALELSAAAGLPAISVSANQGKFLHLLARMVGAKAILELGTLGGYSAIWLARALPPGGKLITLEYEAKHAEVALANLARAGLKDVVELRLGKAAEVLPQLLAEGCGPFELIFIDADKVNYPEYLRWAMKLSRRGTVIVADNVVRKGAVIDPDSTDQNVQGVRKFNEMVANEPGLSATAIQTVGTKGYDGFIIAHVTATT